MADYATLQLLKDALNVSDSTRDDLLQSALTAASRQIDDICGRRFNLDDVASARKYAPSRSTVVDEHGERLLTHDIGAEADLVVEVGRDGDWTDVTTDVELQPFAAADEGRPFTSVLWIDSRFSAYRRVRVTARWGWPDVPEAVQQATLIQAARLFKRKDSPEGVLGSTEWGVARVARVDPDVTALVAHLMMPGFG